jgi:hypothetical protein
VRLLDRCLDVVADPDPALVEQLKQERRHAIDELEMLVALAPPDLVEPAISFSFVVVTTSTSSR